MRICTARTPSDGLATVVDLRRWCRNRIRPVFETPPALLLVLAQRAQSVEYEQ